MKSADLQRLDYIEIPSGAGFAKGTVFSVGEGYVTACMDYSSGQLTTIADRRLRGGRIICRNNVTVPA